MQDVNLSAEKIKNISLKFKDKTSKKSAKTENNN